MKKYCYNKLKISIVLSGMETKVITNSYR